MGGCAAALAAVEQGLSVVLTEPTDWIGGQLTSQAVPPDEHGWIEQFGRNASYQALREGIRDYYLLPGLDMTCGAAPERRTQVKTDNERQSLYE